ncbi:hypothetical protein FOQG_16588 [Fusarium oxysporum f. sp. raphani 54005]|uniref:Uncharacterized protein n=1 Tax=Fusarium oxysporum f. sp. raphani 54005 TaxID=1089458 RepID=X0BJY8_FUSOX|nr:hypothetical protein FOQG_16588 [Fusarium oxysporum f. sp. raphani 54005]
MTNVSQYPVPQTASAPATLHGLPMSGSLASYNVSRGQPHTINHMPRESHAGGYEVYGIQLPSHDGMPYETSNTYQMSSASVCIGRI